MSNRRRQPANGGHPVLTARSFLQGTDFRQVLERDDHAAGLARFACQRRDAETKAQGQSVWSQTVSLEARADLAGRGCIHRISNLSRHVAEEDRSILAANVRCFVARDLFGRCIESINMTLKVGGNHTRSD